MFRMYVAGHGQHLQLLLNNCLSLKYSESDQLCTDNIRLKAYYSYERSMKCNRTINKNSIRAAKSYLVLSGYYLAASISNLTLCIHTILKLVFLYKCIFLKINENYFGICTKQ